MGQIVGYCRVSTNSAEQRRSVKLQEQRLTDHGCDVVLIDANVSGHVEAKRTRSRFPQLIDMILSGEASEVVVPNFDRSQRRMRWGMQLLDALEVRGITLLELDTGTRLDPANNPADVLMAQIRTAVQENESRQRALKVRSAFAARREQGMLPRGAWPFGYQLLNGKAAANPREWADARLLVTRLLVEAGNVNAVLRSLPANFPRAFTPRGLRAWFQNPMLRGGVGYGAPRGTQDYQSVAWGEAPVLINPEEWAAIVKLWAFRQGRGGNGGHAIHLLTGMIRCSNCGKNLHWHTRKGGPHRYACKWPRCGWFGRGLREDVVKRSVIEALTRKASSMAKLARQAVTTRPAMAPEEVRLRGQLEQLEQLREQGLQHLGPQIAKLRDQLVQMEAMPADTYLHPRWQELFADREVLMLGSDEELRVIFCHFLKEIAYQGAPDAWEVLLR